MAGVQCLSGGESHGTSLTFAVTCDIPQVEMDSPVLTLVLVIK